MDAALDMIKKMYDLFLEKDALLIEINPYAEDAITGECKLKQTLGRIINNVWSVKFSRHFYILAHFYKHFKIILVFGELSA